MILAHRIALDPTAEQESYLRQAAGTARFVWNQALAEWKRLYEAGEKPSGLGLKKQFNQTKYQLYPWLQDIHRDAHSQPFTDLQKAFQSFFRRVKAGQKPGYPQFKRKGLHDAFTVANDKLSLDGPRVRLPKVGWIRLREPLRLSGKILGARVSRTADRWFISVQVDCGKNEAPQNEGTTVGVDLGLTSFATLSTGEKVKAPKPLAGALKALRRSQRVVARRKKGSARRAKARARVARLFRRVADVRNDFIHKLTTRLVRENQAVVIEDLNVSGMLKNHRLARAISDVGWAEFSRQLGYKGRLYGCAVLVADRWFPSTKTCSCCGEVKATLSLSERTFRCEACGFTEDRDLNAAQNLHTRGLREIYARGLEGSGSDLRIGVKPCQVEARTRAWAEMSTS